MPVTVRPASHAAKKFERKFAREPVEIFLSSSVSKSRKKVLQDSFVDLTEKNIVGVSNGLVQACIQAYSGHHHLVIRPDDVWITILTQLSLYVNANAEALRSNFVSHDGQKELVIYDEGNRYTTSYSRISDNFTKALEKNINDPSLRDWVLQTFSTTTATDRTVAAVAMMGTLQQYFSYKACLECGIPSVALLGTREDWAKLRDAVADPKRLPEFGEETKVWSEVLGVVLNHFVESFDEPDSSEIKDFWQKIAHFSGGGSGPRYWSGWITAFCFWNEEGKYLRQSPIRIPNESMGGLMMLGRKAERYLNIDGQDFHKVDSSELPPAQVSVPIIVNDNGVKFSGRMIAGCVGLNVTESGEKLEQGGTGLDTLRPETGWWMFEEKEMWLRM